MASEDELQKQLTRRDLLQRAATLAGTGVALDLLGTRVLAAPGGAPQPGGAMPPVGNLLIVQGVDAESLDPHVTTSGASKGMMWAMYDKLL